MVKKFLERVQNRLIWSGLFLTGASILGGFFGFVFQIALGRFLSYSEYAIFISSIAALTIVLSPMNGLCLAITRKITIFLARGLHARTLLFLRDSFIYATLACVGLLLLLFFSRGLLSSWLGGTYWDYLPWMFAVLYSSLIYILMNSALQGFQRFDVLGVLAASQPLIKLGLAAFFVSVLTLQLPGAFMALVLANVLAAGVGGMVILNNIPPKIVRKSVSNTPVNGRWTISFVSNLCFVLMTQLDVIVVQLKFDADVAGSYSAASVLAKAILYLPGGFVLAMFPKAADERVSDSDRLRMFRLSLGLILALSFLGALFFEYFGDHVVEILYGKQYLQRSGLLSSLGWVMIPLAIIYVAEHYLIAIGRSLFVWLLLIVTPIEVVWLFLFCDNTSEVIFALGLFGWVIVGAGLVTVLSVFFRKRKVN